MAFYDDKRFILSHIRHTFITCDDTGMCENVMLSEKPNRYPYESMYHHPFDYNSDDENDFGYGCALSNREYDGDIEDGMEADTLSNVSNEDSFRFSEDDINFFKLTELEFKSELVEENPLQSFDIMSDSYDMGIRRRSNTAVRLEKLKKERKFQAKTKVVNWKSPTKIVSIKEEGPYLQVRRAVLNPTALSAHEIALLEYDEKENQYYETDEYRKYLFPKTVTDSNELNEASDQVGKQIEEIVFPPAKSKIRRKSALTLQIEKSPTIPINPFNQYTRFDGTVSEGNAPTKRVRIFFKINEDDPEFQSSDFTKKVMPSGVTCGTNWIEIVVLANAKVNELIGLICWNYTHLQIGPPLKNDISMYALKIAEENGEVDTDFPSLTGSDDIKRYGFPYLALLEVETQIVVTIFFELEDVFSQINVESPQVTLQEIVDQIKKKRYQLFRDKFSISDSDNLWLELRSQPGIALDLKSPISNYIHSGTTVNMVDFTLKFSAPILFALSDSAKSTGDECNPGNSADNIVLANSSSNLLKANKSSDTLVSNNRSYTALTSLGDDDSGTSLSIGVPNRQTSSSSMKSNKKARKDWSTSMIEIMKAPLYQCFEVTVVNKLYNTPIEMGISGTKVEITPKTAHSKSSSPNFKDRIFSRFQQIKAMNIDVEDVVDCTNATSSKSANSRQFFKLVYFNGSDFKTIKFEGDAATVDDIVFKLKNVMKMRTSLRRSEYQAIKQRKKSLSSKVYFRSNFKISSGSSSSDDESNDLGTSGSGGSSVGTTDNDNNYDGKSVGGSGSEHHFFSKRDNKLRKFRKP